MGFICYVCDESLSSILALSSHFKVFHNFTPCSKYYCKQTNCFRIFDCLDTFKKHLKRKHSVDSECPKTNINPNEINPSSVDCLDSVVDKDQNQTQATDQFCESSSRSFRSIVETGACSFLAKIQSSNVVTKSHIQELVGEITEFLGCGFIDVLQEKVVAILKSPSISNNDIQTVNDMFETLKNPFANVSTEYMRNKYFAEKGTLIEPIPYIISDTLLPKSVDGETVLTPHNIIGHHVPMSKVLKALFELPNFFESVINYINNLVNSDPNCLSNFVQGSLWGKKTIDHNNDWNIPIFIYYDDYECNNPLGSHSGLQKLGAVYFSLPVIPPQFSAELANIFLVLLFHSNDRVKFGNRPVFQPLINELKVLETDGVKVHILGSEITIKFKLGLILGDNLGLNSILGFSESFSCNYSCRFCKVHKRTMGSMTQESPDLLRTKEVHESDVLLSNVTVSGVKEKCVFDDLKSFSNVQNLSVDIMHDLLEGVCRYDLSKIILNFVNEKKYFTLETLNARLDAFHFGPLLGSNKPTKIKAEKLLNNNLGLSASEMLCFIRVFPYLIGDLVSKDDIVWDFYLNLRKIIDIVFSKKMHKETRLYLSVLIQEHLEMYTQLFNDSIKPKHHHLLHYCRIIELVGPLSHLSAMRFESKHRESKQAAYVSHNRKNITYTLAMKHQMKLNERLFSKAGLVSTITVGVCKPLLSSTVYDEIKEYLPDNVLSNVQQFTLVTHVTVEKKTYKKDLILFTSLDENDLPVFRKIKYILLDDLKNVYFICKIVDNLGFYLHYESYEVEVLKDYTFVLLSSLFDTKPSYCYLSSAGHVFVPLF